MYESFYALQERPFDLTANPRFLFLASGHREALSNLQFGIDANKGITLLIGEAGTGKTTLIRAALEQQRGTNAAIVYLSNPTLTRAEFYEFLASGFSLSANAAHSKTVFLQELEATIRRRRASGGISALIVDEAQSMPHELLEEIRLLANLETTNEKLLPVVLTGQPELATRLNQPELRQLKQRVALRCSLPPFDLRESAAYIAKRIRVAGGDSASVFTREAVEAIYRGSQGIARTISVVCDNALINGFALQRRPVDADIVIDVCQDFDLLRSGSPAVEQHVPHVPARPPAAQATHHQTAPPGPHPAPAQSPQHLSSQHGGPQHAAPRPPAPVAVPRTTELRVHDGGFAPHPGAAPGEAGSGAAADPRENDEYFSVFSKRKKFLFF
jgi:general secretion pathway protein A